MRSVMLSIQPKWCELIASGKKTVEIRKTKPKLETPFKVYIYCSSIARVNLDEYTKIFRATNGRIDDWHGKVIGEFVCDEIKRIHCQSIEKEAICAIAVGNGDKEYYDNSCVSYKEAYRYLRNVKKAYGWHISDLVIYDKSKELSEFFKYCGDDPKCEGCEAFHYSNTESGKEECCCSVVYGCRPLKRPPQSWCYVEGGEQK